MNRETLKKLKSEAMELRRIAKKGLTREGNRKELFAKMKQMISKYDTDTPSASDQPEPTKKAPSKPKKHPNPNESFKNTTHANEKSDEQFRKETLKFRELRLDLETQGLDPRTARATKERLEREWKEANEKTGSIDPVSKP